MEEISKIIDWYRDIPVGYNDINRLIYSRQKLSGYFYVLVEDMNEFRKFVNDAQAIYENRKSTLRVQNMSKGVTKADYISRAKTIQEYEDWKEADANYKGYFYLYKAVEAVLDSMSQQIATLRAELKTSIKDN